MTISFAIVSIVAGLVLLVCGGEVLVRGASALAAVARISPLLIGLTVVAFGTSAPELAVTVQASYAGQSDLAVGNVVGSNIMNVLFILGLSAVITPLVISSQLIRRDVPLMIAASVVMLLLGLDGKFGRWDGILLIAGLIAYLVWSIRQSRKETLAVQQAFCQEAAAVRSTSFRSVFLHLALILLGLVLLTVGSRLLVDGSSSIARLLGIAELLIGLTIVALGTSLPEVVTSVVASIRGERDIAAGNVVGSNMFNILGVLGLASLTAGEPIPVSPAALRFDIPVMIAVAVACLPIFLTGSLIARWEGVLFVAYYLAYMTYLILAATQSEISRTFGVIMVGFVLPLTAITLGISLVRAVRRRQPAL